MVYHSVILDAESLTSQCHIEIPEGDINSHQLLIKLVHSNGTFFNVTGYDPVISFFDLKNKVVVETDAVTVINAYRGQLSYVIGDRLTEHYQRYVVKLTLNKDDTSVVSFDFIVNVIKNKSDKCPCPEPEYEVIITKDFYEKLKSHVDDKSIHLSDSDRSLLDFLSDNYDTLVTTGTYNNLYELITTSEEFKSVLEEEVRAIIHNDESVHEMINEASMEAVDNNLDKITSEVIESVEEQLDGRLGSLENRVAILEGDIDWGEPLV